jgi:hypothetical protein
MTPVTILVVVDPYGHPLRARCTACHTRWTQPRWIPADQPDLPARTAQLESWAHHHPCTDSRLERPVLFDPVTVDHDQATALDAIAVGDETAPGSVRSGTDAGPVPPSQETGPATCPYCHRPLTHRATR